MGRVRTPILALALALASLLAVGTHPAAAQDATPDALTSLSFTISAHEFFFEGPAEVPAGLVTVTMANEGDFRHHVQLFKLNDGVTADVFEAGLETGAAFDQGIAVGGPATVPGGQSSSVILRLDAGDYVALCFVTGRDGIPHFAKGMFTPFTVTGEDAGDPDPEADAEVLLDDDFSITLPEGAVVAGRHVWKVTNEGEFPHELEVLRMPEGVSAEDYAAEAMAADSATPPASPAADAPRPTDVGGMKVLGEGGGGWAILDLEPGEYVAICLVSGPDGTTHAERGMVVAFTVE